MLNSTFIQQKLEMMTMLEDKEFSKPFLMGTRLAGPGRSYVYGASEDKNADVGFQGSESLM